MFRTSKYRSYRVLNFLILTLLALTSVLVVSPQPAVYAATLSNPRIELSVDSGPTGQIITIRGYEQYPITRYGDYGLLAFQTDDPNSSLPPYLVFGAASVKKDGTFIWQGPLPAAGIYDSAGVGAPTNYKVPLGKIKISFFRFNTYVGGKADYFVTDNSSGPFADNTNDPLLQMYQLWLRTDQLIREGKVSRSWLWGPLNLGGGTVTKLEPYTEASHGWRFVTYYDKTRMEVTYPNDPIENNSYYVTNGLLVKEMVTGQLQLGNTNFRSSGAATIPAAGDLSVYNPTPTFSTYAGVLDVNKNIDNGEIRRTLASDGQTFSNNALPDYKVTAVHLVKETNHYIASPFWNYLNSTGLIQDQAGQQYQGRIFDPLFYATGFPITEAYWTTTRVGGYNKDVLVQLFERRVLTYTPSNSPAFQVEMGNVGLQYNQWRYQTS